MTGVVETSKKSLQSPGDVDIQELFLISARGDYINIDDYLVELNIYESIDSHTMSGEIVMSDKANLTKILPIVGDEYLMVKLKTPDFPDAYVISKTFRIYSITNRSIPVDQNTQQYILRFCSIESIVDTINPIYKTFSGKISDVAGEIFADYLQSPRTFYLKDDKLNIGEEKSSLIILNDTSNKVKFNSPGWGPLKCLNWLTNKAIPKDNQACNFMFWESNKFFYFGSLEKIFLRNELGSVGTIGEYHYAPPGTFRTIDIHKKMFLIENLSIKKLNDSLQNSSLGYLSSTLYTLDVINKKYEEFEYDHLESFNKYTHVSGKNALPLFTSPLRNPLSFTSIYTKNPGLFDNAPDNVNEKMGTIYGNRRSNMLDLNNFVLEITVPGRTDVEVGSLIDLIFPDISPKDESDTTMSNDRLYSGKYLITAIRHKVTPVRHHMIMEIVKDSFQGDFKEARTKFADVL